MECTSSLVFFFSYFDIDGDLNVLGEKTIKFNASVFAIIKQG